MEVLISVLYWSLRLVSVYCAFDIAYASGFSYVSQIDERLVIPEWAVIPLNAGKTISLDFNIAGC